MISKERNENNGKAAYESLHLDASKFVHHHLHVITARSSADAAQTLIRHEWYVIVRLVLVSNQRVEGRSASCPIAELAPFK